MCPDKYNFFCQVVSDSMLAELKQCFLEAYDDNRDGKIDIREVWKRQNAIFLCVGIHLHLLQKKLYRLLDTAAITFIHQRRQRGQKKVQLLSYFYYCKVGGNPKAWDIAKKSFPCIFYFFPLFLFLFPGNTFSKCISPFGRVV